MGVRHEPNVMHVLRGQAAEPERDQAVTRALLAEVADSGTPALRVWSPPKVLAFGRRDSTREAYADARDAARSRGFPPVERMTGGHAVAFTGTTVAFVRSTPVDDSRTGIRTRYDRTVEEVARALEHLGVDADSGEPANSFCPGTCSLSVTGKIAGLAQRIRSDVAIIAGVVIVRDHAEIASVLDHVYAALNVPFDPDTVGSIARAGGNTERQDTIEALINALADDSSVEWVRET